MRKAFLQSLWCSSLHAYVRVDLYSSLMKSSKSSSSSRSTYFFRNLFKSSYQFLFVSFVRGGSSIACCLSRFTISSSLVSWLIIFSRIF